MFHDLCHCGHNQVSGASDSSREEERMSDMAGELTQSQEDTLAKFRELLSEQGLLRKKDDDYSLLRFLRARGFDIAKAKAMFEAMLEWRQEIGADTIREVLAYARSPASFSRSRLPFLLAMETYNNVSLSDGSWLLRACTDVACFVHCIDVELDWTSSCDGGRRSSFQRRRQFEISIHTFIIRRTSLGDLFTLNG